MKMKPDDHYYIWLLSLIENEQYDVDNYGNLLHQLYKKEFTWSLRRDENRYYDGLNLKDRYLDEVIPFEYHRDKSDNFCSVLEMMIALADHTEEEIMYDPDYGDRTSVWFWMMIENLRLTEFTNDNYDFNEVEKILDFALKRSYRKDGIGGFFWTKRTDIDMRKTELWYQMNYFLEENVIEF